MSAIDRRRFLRGAMIVGTALAAGSIDLDQVTAAEAKRAPTIAGCSRWGAAPATSAITVLEHPPNRIIVHHTDTPNVADRSAAHAFELARAIQRSHFGNGWIDSGQHFTISRGGVVMEGRHRSLAAAAGGRRQVVGAHCPGQNEVAIGIENEGTYSTHAPPAALYARLVAMSAYLCRSFGIPSTQIYGHRDFFSTDCPGDALYRMLPRLRADVATRIGGR